MKTSLANEIVIDLTIRVRVGDVAKLRRGMQPCYQPETADPDELRRCVAEFLASKADAGLRHVEGVSDVRLQRDAVRVVIGSQP